MAYRYSHPQPNAYKYISPRLAANVTLCGINTGNRREERIKAQQVGAGGKRRQGQWLFPDAAPALSGRDQRTKPRHIRM